MASTTIDCIWVVSRKSRRGSVALPLMWVTAIGGGAGSLPAQHGDASSAIPIKNLFAMVSIFYRSPKRGGTYTPRASSGKVAAHKTTDNRKPRTSAGRSELAAV